MKHKTRLQLITLLTAFIAVGSVWFGFSGKLLAATEYIMQSSSGVMGVDSGLNSRIGIKEIMSPEEIGSPTDGEEMTLDTKLVLGVLAFFALLAILVILLSYAPQIIKYTKRIFRLLPSPTLSFFRHPRANKNNLIINLKSQVPSSHLAGNRPKVDKFQVPSSKLRAICSRFQVPGFKLLIPISILILTIASSAYFFFSGNVAGVAEAGWWNDNWSYRKAITITNNTSNEYNVYASTSLDTLTASTSMQADCGDFRFINSAGQTLEYYIVSGCRTLNNIIHINFATFPAGEQTIYFYYGNQGAPNGFSASDFATEASDYTWGTVQAEETGPGPVGYWSFNEGYGTTANDSSGQGNDGTITGATWQDESMCVSGKCLYLDGSGEYVEIPDFDL